METKLKVEGMSCQHCVAAVTQALMELSDAVEGASVRLDSGEVCVQHGEGVTREAMAQAIEGVGFDVVG